MLQPIEDAQIKLPCISPTKVASSPTDSATAQVSPLAPCMVGDLRGKGSKGADVALLAKVPHVPVPESHSFPSSSTTKGASGED